MIEKTLNFFWQLAGWKAFTGALVLYIFFGAVVMPLGAKKFSEVSGKKVEILDLQFFYSPEKARNIISEYGDAGRQYAIQFGLIADTLYPISYTLLFIILTAWIYKSINSGNSVYLLCLSLLIMLIDYCENLNIASLMYKYPAVSDLQIYVSSMFTSAKWTLVLGQVLLIVVGLVWLGYLKLIKKAH